MVAYSFNKRFAEDILLRRKNQTIRAHGKRRHARPGESIQLYTGMRTKHCRKLLADPVCSAVNNIEILVPKAPGLCQVTLFSVVCEVTDRFARDDGFCDAEDFTQFWRHTHGEGLFQGVLIEWLHVERGAE